MLPTVKKNLLPRKIKGAQEQLLQCQVTMKHFHDRSAKDLPELKSGGSAHIRVGSEWEPAMVMSHHQTPRSYNVITPDGREWRRNLSYLLATKATAPTISPHIAKYVTSDTNTKSKPWGIVPRDIPSPMATPVTTPSQVLGGGTSTPSSTRFTWRGRAVITPARYRD